ncbi:MAG: hypothetical protein AAF197_11445 [Pseudomonadota bacterium]
MSLPIALRIASALILLIVIGERIFLGVWMLPPLLVVIPTLIILSFVYSRAPIGVARAVMVISVILPLLALNGFLQGFLVVLIPILDTLIFGWLFFLALKVVRGQT